MTDTKGQGIYNAVVIGAGTAGLVTSAGTAGLGGRAAKEESTMADGPIEFRLGYDQAA